MYNPDNFQEEKRMRRRNILDRETTDFLKTEGMYMLEISYILKAYFDKAKL